MAVSPPLYGNIQIDDQLDINTLIDRLQRVSENFLDQSSFSAYMVAQDGQRFYGLDDTEVIDLYQDYQGSIQTLAFSISAPNGGGVRVNLQLVKGARALQGQFIIATGRRWVNQEIWEILHGTWVPKTRPDSQLMAMLEGIARTKATEEAEKARYAQLAAPPKEKKRLFYREEVFSLDPQVSYQRIIGLLEELSIVFIDEEPFHFRLGTTDGDYFVDISQSKLRHIFRFERSRIHTLYIDASTEDGQRIDIVLRFYKAGHNPDALVEVTAYDSNEIISHVKEILGRKNIYTLKETAIFHKKFVFDQEAFSIETLVILLNAILATYLKEVNPITGLYTFSGKSFTQLSLNQLKEAFHRNEGQVKKMTISASSANGTLFFFLLFRWETNGETQGEIQMNLGDEERHQTVKELVWERLKLTPAQIKAGTVPQDVTDMIVRPVFSSREFSERGKSCLMIMPLEAYWSDPIWTCIQHTLEGLNFEYLTRAISLNEQNALDQIWQQINEVDWLIVDLTYRQPDVFYFLGVGHAVGKKVLLITQHERDIPKEFLQFDYLVYDNNLAGLEKLQLELKDRMA